MSIPRITNFLEPTTVSYKRARLIYSLLFGIAFFGIAISLFKELNFIVFMAPVLSWMSYDVFGSFIDQDRYNKAKSEFLSHLPEYSAEYLSHLSASPEISSDDRKLIIKYLNGNHPGWSLNNAPKVHSD